MSKSLLEKRVDESTESKRAFAQEELILDTAEQIWDLMEAKGIRKARLAETLGRSAAYVTQLLNGSRNMTLRSLADVASALGGTVHIRIVDSAKHNGWHVDTRQSLQTVTRVTEAPVIDPCNGAANESSIATIIKFPTRRYG